MSQETQDFTQALGDKFNQMMDNPTLFSVDKTEEQKKDDLRQNLITSVENARTNISQSIKNFREYYIQTYGIEKWVEFNKNPHMFGTPMFLVTGVNPNISSNPVIPGDLGFLSPSASDANYHTSPSFYKKMYDIYLKNATTSAKYYGDMTDESPGKYGYSVSDTLYKLFNIDLDTQIKSHINDSNVNERKSYYETQETNVLYDTIVILQTFYFRMIILLCFISLYLFFLTQEISIVSFVKQILYLILLIIIPYMITGGIRLVMIITKRIYEYIPANIWITKMSTSNE